MSGELLALEALLVALILGSLVAFVTGARRLRLVADTPTARIRSAAQGPVELTGQAALLPGPPIIAPLSGTPCAWYEYRVERRHRGNNGNTRWRTVHSGRSSDLFALDDDTGRCVVDPEGARVHTPHRERWHGHRANPQAAPLPAALLDGGHYRYLERRIHPGDPLYALGHFRSHGGADPGPLKDEVTALLREWKRDARRMAAIDTDGDGQVDLAEWDRAREMAQRQALEARAQRAREPQVHLLGRGPQRGMPYLLSVYPESRLLRGLRWRARLGAVGFLSGIGGLAWLLLGGAQGLGLQ
ncbi:E3 Ubiquitin ligase [Ectothiorhodospira mobilis]|uniref:RING-type E3 ubiquitin transferase n=1 Tax=Ectothiorhodospira mobilis TaxID=195064 RepID=A0A1I4R0A2_ECTMO|nr:GIDE domain-containing protein [Ectothiorhodospira mobilis]SFM45671.1 E3 Ubiquitin ligase [Ectothiorhodospira mobilis]